MVGDLETEMTRWLKTKGQPFVNEKTEKEYTFYRKAGQWKGMEKRRLKYSF